MRKNPHFSRPAGRGPLPQPAAALPQTPGRGLLSACFLQNLNAKKGVSHLFGVEEVRQAPMGACINIRPEPDPLGIFMQGVGSRGGARGRLTGRRGRRRGLARGRYTLPNPRLGSRLCYHYIFPGRHDQVKTV